LLLFISSFDVRSAFYEQQQRQVVVVVELNSCTNKSEEEKASIFVYLRVFTRWFVC